MTAWGKPLSLATPFALTLSWPSWAVLPPSGRLSQRDPLASPRVDRKQLPQRRGDRETGPCGVCQCSSSRAKPNVNGFSCPRAYMGCCPRFITRQCASLRSVFSSACRTRRESVIKRDWLDLTEVLYQAE